MALSPAEVSFVNDTFWLAHQLRCTDAVLGAALAAPGAGNAAASRARMPRYVLIFVQQLLPKVLRPATLPMHGGLLAKSLLPIAAAIADRTQSQHAALAEQAEGAAGEVVRANAAAWSELAAELHALQGCLESEDVSGACGCDGQLQGAASRVSAAMAGLASLPLEAASELVAGAMGASITAIAGMLPASSSTAVTAAGSGAAAAQLTSVELSTIDVSTASLNKYTESEAHMKALEAANEVASSRDDSPDLADMAEKAATGLGYLSTAYKAVKEHGGKLAKVGQYAARAASAASTAGRFVGGVVSCLKEAGRFAAMGSVGGPIGMAVGAVFGLVKGVAGYKSSMGQADKMGEQVSRVAGLVTGLSEHMQKGMEDLSKQSEEQFKALSTQSKAEYEALASQSDAQFRAMTAQFASGMGALSEQVQAGFQQALWMQSQSYSAMVEQFAL
ncbi:unnamed protein product, partial [Symbiodinium sp. KB8]